MAVRSRRRTSALGRSATVGGRPKPVDHRIEKRPFAPPSIMGYCLGSLKVCDADNNWEIRFLYGSA